MIFNRLHQETELSIICQGNQRNSNINRNRYKESKRAKLLKYVIYFSGLYFINRSKEIQN